MILLENKTDLLVAQRRALFRLQMMDGRLVKKIFAIPTVIVHSEDMEQGRFPGARWSHHRNELAFRDFDLDVAQNVEKLSMPQRVVSLKIPEPDHGGRLHSLGRDPAVFHHSSMEQLDGRLGVLAE